MIPVPIRLYIVDPHPITRAGVSRLFRSEAAVLVVGGASNSLALLAGVVEACHVVVAEIATEQSIVDVETLLTHRPSVKVIAFTDCEGSAFVQRFARAGGVGYVSKSAPSLDGLFRAVLAAAAGHTPLDSRLAAALARPSMAVPLSARELEVLRRVAGGEAMTGIATALACNNTRAQRRDGAVNAHACQFRHDRCHRSILGSLWQTRLDATERVRLGAPTFSGAG